MVSVLNCVQYVEGLVIKGSGSRMVEVYYAQDTSGSLVTSIGIKNTI